MRFVQFLRDGRRGVGAEVQEGGDIADLTATDPSFPTGLKEVIQGGEFMLKKAERILQSGPPTIPRSASTLLAPIRSPGKVVCVGQNYRDPNKPTTAPPPPEPVCFGKWSSTVIGPDESIPYPEESDQLDYEVEMAVVVGRGGRRIRREDALGHVFGVTCANDVSARDWQRRTGGQVTLGKALDGSCPLGPSVVTLDDIGDLSNLRLWTSVNGEIQQDGNTRDMIFSIEDIIVHISRFMTLTHGDVILTGSPRGSAWHSDSPRFLSRGDRVVCGLQGVGVISNTIV